MAVRTLHVLDFVINSFYMALQCAWANGCKMTLRTILIDLQVHSSYVIVQGCSLGALLITKGTFLQFSLFMNCFDMHIKGLIPTCDIATMRALLIPYLLMHQFDVRFDM